MATNSIVSPTELLPSIDMEEMLKQEQLDTLLGSIAEEFKISRRLSGQSLPEDELDLEASKILETYRYLAQESGVQLAQLGFSEYVASQHDVDETVALSWLELIDAHNGFVTKTEPIVEDNSARTVPVLHLLQDVYPPSFVQEAHPAMRQKRLGAFARIASRIALVGAAAASALPASAMNPTTYVSSKFMPIQVGVNTSTTTLPSPSFTKITVKATATEELVFSSGSQDFFVQEVAQPDFVVNHQAEALQDAVVITPMIPLEELETPSTTISNSEDTFMQAMQTDFIIGQTYLADTVTQSSNDSLTFVDNDGDFTEENLLFSDNADDFVDNMLTFDDIRVVAFIDPEIYAATTVAGAGSGVIEQIDKVIGDKASYQTSVSIFNEVSSELPLIDEDIVRSPSTWGGYAIRAKNAVINVGEILRRSSYDPETGELKKKKLLSRFKK